MVESPCCRRDVQQPSPTPQFKSINYPALAFFIVQLSHPYMTTRKTIALTGQTFAFYNLSRLVIAFLPKSEHLLISWLQSSTPVILLAIAKSLQSCPTRCDPTDGSPPGSAIPGILQAITLEWVAIFLSNA